MLYGYRIAFGTIRFYRVLLGQRYSISNHLNTEENMSVPIWVYYRLEEERVSGSEARAALRNLVLMISSLCACGFSELRPTRANTEMFQLQGFVLPQPTTPGQAVRNVQAFQVRN